MLASAQLRAAEAGQAAAQYPSKAQAAALAVAVDSLQRLHHF